MACDACPTAQVTQCPKSLWCWPATLSCTALLPGRYSPPGNYINQFASNVGPVGSSTPSTTVAPTPARAPAPAPAPTPVQQQTSSQPTTTTVQAATLRQGGVLNEGNCLASPNQRYRLCMQTIGRLVSVLQCGSCWLGMTGWHA
jgi:hypothetical protein